MFVTLIRSINICKPGEWWKLIGERKNTSRNCLKLASTSPEGVMSTALHSSSVRRRLGRSKSVWIWKYQFFHDVITTILLSIHVLQIYVLLLVYSQSTHFYCWIMTASISNDDTNQYNIWGFQNNKDCPWI